MIVVRIEEVGAIEFSQVEPFPMGYEFDKRLMDQRPFGLDPTQLLGLSNEIRIEFNVGSQVLAPQHVCGKRV